MESHGVGVDGLDLVCVAWIAVRCVVSNCVAFYRVILCRIKRDHAVFVKLLLLYCAALYCA